MDIEKINIEIRKPEYKTRTKVYVPEKNRVTETEIIGYVIRMFEEDGNLVGGVSEYRVGQLVSVRGWQENISMDEVRSSDFYTNKKKAKKASRFLKVNADEETWKLAISDRDEKDPDSPYSIENCGLPRCCSILSNARSLLYFCKEEEGLIVHDRDYLAELLLNHHFKKHTSSPGYKAGDPIDKILLQLEIDK